MLNEFKGIKQGASKKTKERPECPERVEKVFITLNKVAEEVLKNMLKE